MRDTTELSLLQAHKDHAFTALKLAIAAVSTIGPRSNSASETEVEKT